jgi:glycosyltransferase involved in cell wall biosynthesis
MALGRAVTLRSAAYRALLLGQRLGLPVPARLRSRLRHVARRAGVSPRLDAWADPPPVVTDVAQRAERLPRWARRPSIATLRCAVVTSQLDVGGMDQVAAVLAQVLPRYDVETTLVFAPADGEWWQASARLANELRASGTPVVEVDEGSASSWLRTWRPDVVSAHSPPAWMLSQLAELDVPVVETVHGLHGLFDGDMTAEAARLRQVARLVTVSDLLRQQYLGRVPGLRPEDVVAIPNGCLAGRSRGASPAIDRKRARQWLGVGDEPLVVSLGRFALQKNAFGLLSAFDQAARRCPATLLVAGRPDDPHYVAQVLEHRRRLAAAPRIRLRDHTPWPEVVLAAADVFVLDSFYEGWPLATMDALVAGVPIVASEVAGAAEQVAVGGVLVTNPLGDPDAVTWEGMRRARFSRQVNEAELADALVTLVGDVSRLRRERLELAAAARRRFDVDTMVARHAGVLIEAAARAAVRA